MHPYRVLPSCGRVRTTSITPTIAKHQKFVVVDVAFEIQLTLDEK